VKKKLDISPEELKKLVWEKPIYQIAIEKGVSDTTIRKWCEKFEIKRPPQGYWIKKKKVN